MPPYDQKFIDNTKIERIGNNFFCVVTNPICELKQSDEVWADIIYDHVCKKANNIKDHNGYYSLNDIKSMLEALSAFFSETTINIIEREINTLSSLNIPPGKEMTYNEAKEIDKEAKKKMQNVNVNKESEGKKKKKKLYCTCWLFR